MEGYHRKAYRMGNFEESGNVGKVMNTAVDVPHQGQSGPIYPCTALAVFRILESFLRDSNSDISTGRNNKISTFENNITTIVNRSEVVGLPLATMLSNQGCTVYSVDVNSILKYLPNGKIRREPSAMTLDQCIRMSSVIVSGVPSTVFNIPTEWIADHAIAINVAMESNFDEDSLVRDKPGVTYVPHVGRVTVAALEFNLICLHRNYHS